MPARSKVFISYCHKESNHLKQLQTHLSPLNDAGIDVWDDTHLAIGDEWKAEIKKALAEAKVAILLVSPGFLASRFIKDEEIPEIIAAAEKEGLKVFSVIVKPCRFLQNPFLSKYQAANGPDKTLSEMKPAERDRVWLKVVGALEALLSPPQP